MTICKYCGAVFLERKHKGRKGEFCSKLCKGRLYYKLKKERMRLDCPDFDICAENNRNVEVPPRLMRFLVLMMKACLSYKCRGGRQKPDINLKLLQEAWQEFCRNEEACEVG